MSKEQLTQILKDHNLRITNCRLDVMQLFLDEKMFTCDVVGGSAAAARRAVEQLATPRPRAAAHSIVTYA